MGKRAHGEGSVTHRKDGRWMTSMTLENGSRKYFYGDTQKEALEKLREAQHQQKQGTLATGKAQTLRVYLDRWLEDAHRTSLKPSSYADYRRVIDKHIVPVLGHIQLQKLTPQHIQSFYAKELKAGLSARTVNKYHALLHKALDNAVRWNLVARNVCDVVTKPRETKYEIQPLTEEQARKLLDTVRGNVLEGIITIALTTGMRRGELLGLKWEDIDFKGKNIVVRRSVTYVNKVGVVELEPKTQKSRRKIMLPDFAIEVLKQHQTRLQERKAQLGSAWQESGYVFCNGRGGFLQEKQLYDMYKRLLKRAGLPNIRFHDLRHSAATIMIKMGVNPKVVQEVLGHSNINITLNIYTHVLPSMQQEVATKLDNLFGKL